MTDAEKARRELAYAFKNCRQVTSGQHAGRDAIDVVIEIARQYREQECSDFFEGTTLVPVPTSGVGVDKPGDDLWSGRELAERLASEFEAQWCPALVRHTAVSKSSNSGSRSLERHLQSIRLDQLPETRTVILVDDHVTTGATMCACAQLLWDAVPGLVVAGYAVAYVPSPAETSFFDFATRLYEWTGTLDKPQNTLVAAGRLRPQPCR
ncbi:MAG: hypothetical protein HC927_12545 [Deltaproteobacteria bacterium]|nr:hypothetical protein [Deltaproteobacteria bacterium]